MSKPPPDAITLQLQQVEAAIATIYQRSCKNPGDRKRLEKLKAEQTRLTAARRQEHAKSRQHDGSWHHTPGYKGAR